MGTCISAVVADHGDEMAGPSWSLMLGIC